MNQNSLSLFNSAELAFAAYATLVNGPTEDQIDLLVAAEMSRTQAKQFVLRYISVVTQFSDATGFSATVFADASGNLTTARPCSKARCRTSSTRWRHSRRLPPARPTCRRRTLRS